MTVSGSPQQATEPSSLTPQFWERIGKPASCCVASSQETSDQAAPRHTAPPPGGGLGSVPVPPSCKIRTVVLWYRHDAQVSPSSGPPTRSSSLEPAAYVCTGGVQRESPCGSVWGCSPKPTTIRGRVGDRSECCFETSSLEPYGSATVHYGIATTSLRLITALLRSPYALLRLLLRLRA